MKLNLSLIADILCTNSLWMRWLWKAIHHIVLNISCYYHRLVKAAFSSFIHFHASDFAYSTYCYHVSRLILLTFTTQYISFTWFIIAGEKKYITWGSEMISSKKTSYGFQLYFFNFSFLYFSILLQSGMKLI